MNPLQIAIVPADGSTEDAHNVLRRLHEGWTSSREVDLEVLAPSGLTDELIAGLDAVVFVNAARTEKRQVLHMLAGLEEASAPSVILAVEREPNLAAYTFAGALVLASETPDIQLAATLYGLAHRQSGVRQLKREVAVAERFQGGLEGQIARMHDELQLAAMVQREYLPRQIPSLHGIEIAAMWRPVNYVSGDIYDVQQLDDDHIGVFVADAVGHGVPAALMTMVICRSLVMRTESGGDSQIIQPRHVLARLNQDLIHRKSTSSRFATAVYALIDCRKRTATIAGAGHPPPFRLNADGTVDTISTNGGLLGIFDDETYDQVTIDLAVGDRLLFYSDGFEVAFPPDKDGEHHIDPTIYRDEFAQLAEIESPAKMIEIIRRRVNDQRGSLHQVDDLTLVTLAAGPLVQEDSPPSTEKLAATIWM